MLKELMQLSDDFEILFLHGGARLQNCMVPYNICTKYTANYIDTGTWSTKSFEESALIRDSKIIASSADKHYSYIPKELNWNGQGYLHITTNNTIHGTQFHNFEFTKQGIVVADMSSDILSREINFNAFGLIYAGLQKNLGTAGGTLVIIKKELLEDLPKVPSMLNYKQHVKNDSMLNTPPVFAVLMCKLVLDWMQKEGGLAAIENRNKHKSALLYEAIDSIDAFEGFSQKEDRSLMNVTFKLCDPVRENTFNELLKQENIIGLKGHRSKGGYRASLYNQLPLTHVEHLVEVLRKFSQM
jgi:phosphoserine aminotransferase